MSIASTIDKDIITAMKAREEHKLTTLRMVKAALKSKAIDKRAELTDAEESQILSTLIKQRRESVESFTKGNRPELAQKEREEIVIIEHYLPQEASEDEIRKVVLQVLDSMQKDAGGVKCTPKDMGTAMRIAQQWILANGLRANGKVVSDIVKAELAK